MNKQNHKHRRVLVVDDDREMRQMMSLILDMMGIEEIVQAADGEDAFYLLYHYDFDLVISDWMMPLMSGLELLKKMKEVKAFRKIPFILVTSEAQSVNVEKAMEAGVDDYIVKPYTPDIIMERVSLILA